MAMTPPESSPQPLTPEDDACLRALAGAHFLGGEVTLPSGRKLSADEMQALTSAYAPTRDARPEFSAPSAPKDPPNDTSWIKMEGPKREHRNSLVVLIAGLVVLAVVGAVLAVVFGSKSPDKPGVSTYKPIYDNGAVPVAPATSEPAPTPATATHKLGEQVITGGGVGKVNAFAFRQPVAKNAPPPEQAGFEWAAADVEVCALVDGIYVNRAPWYLVYADHTTIAASNIGYNQFPEPAYPWGDTGLPKDRCVRGWIVFPAPVDKRPVSIEHHPAGALTEWAIA